MNPNSSPLPNTTPAKTIVQCDFDDTVTIGDASFIMLDTFARGDWHQINRDYEAGRITVGRFNEDAFALVRATKTALLASIKGKVNIRPGFPEFAASCRRRGFRLVIVSNGLDFYIQEILQNIGLPGIEVHAAHTVFHGGRLTVRYLGPDGSVLDDAFKEAYVTHYLYQDYRVLYVGNGSSDFLPARKCHHIFATGTLLERCDQAGVERTAFDDFYEVTRVLDAIPG